MEHFHLTKDDISDMTDWQIDELCFHVREEDGTIKPQKRSTSDGPETVQQALTQWKILSGQLRLPKDQVTEGVKKIKAKWASKETNGGG